MCQENATFSKQEQDAMKWEHLETRKMVLLEINSVNAETQNFPKELKNEVQKIVQKIGHKRGDRRREKARTQKTNA